MLLVLVPSSPPSGTLVYEWVDPQGVVRALSEDDTVRVLHGERGLGHPDVGLSEDKLPFAPGTVLRHGMTEARRIELPIYFSAATPAALEALMDSVYGWFATATEVSRTPGYFRVTRRDDTQRQIACYYEGGLSGDLSFGHAGLAWQTATVRLKAPDPWATDIEPTTGSWDSTEWASFAVMNTGQIDAYPIWTITGPGAGIAIGNNTTGKAIGFAGSIAAGKTLTIDTRPSNQRTTVSVYDSDDVNRYADLIAISELWTLQAGSNSLAVSMSGATGATLVELSFLPRYRGLTR
jgi:hypothetical protein